MEDRMEKKTFYLVDGAALPEVYINVVKAKQLLKDPDLPIQHIAYSVGYNDPFAFSKVFKKETGISPSQYRTDYLNSK